MVSIAKPSEIILAIESSCDDTCASVVTGDLKVLSNVVSSQIDIHKLYGGVVPEIASRNHAMNILGVCNQALEQAGVDVSDITKVAATTHPGLRGAVMVGQIFGESFASARQIPFVAINHLAGHIASVVFGNDVQFPFMSLLVSGGHTSLYLVKSWQDIKLVCETMDDACGEAFDKVAKILGLEYPGGVKIQELSKKHKGDLMTFVKSNKLDGFSYSGLKTAVLNYVNREKQMGKEIDIPFVCASFQHEAVMQLVNKSMEGMKKHNVKLLCVCGGVSANEYLRDQMAISTGKIGGKVIFPKMEYCMDNAAMIGAVALLGVKIKN